MRKPSTHYLIERSKGRVYSAVLHGVWLFFVIMGLPSFLVTKPPVEPVAITVELLPISQISNVKPSEAQPEQEQKPEEKPPEIKKASPPVKTAEAPPPPPAPDAVPLPDKLKEKEKEKEKKPEPPKEKKEEPKPKEKKKKPDDLAAILRAVKETAQKENKDSKKEKQKPTETPSETKSISSQYNPTIPMSMSERDAIMSQISKCWNVPAGAKDAQNLSVVIMADYNIDGTYTKAVVAPASAARYQSDPFFRAAADAAIRAVQRCSPLQGLTPEKYDTWKQMELNFDPKYMLN
jgi:outer membrane biosynthesis protein TonB